MWKEVSAKSAPATVAFGAIAIFFYFHDFHMEKYHFSVQFLSVIIVFANTLRLIAAKKLRLKVTIDKKDRYLMKLPIWINSLCWGLIFALISWELNSSGPHFIISISVMVGFAAASIVTLAYDKSLFIPHQLLHVGPQILIMYIQYSSGSNPDALFLSGAFVVLLVYNLKQGNDYREQLLDRFHGELELQESYQELKRSQDLLVSQTAKLIQASRLQALADMAGGLSHEINNSSMAILGSVQQMERDLRSKNLLEEKNRRRITIVVDAIMKIKNVIEGLKFFSLEMPPSEKQVIPLSGLIERTFNYTQEMLKAHNVVLRVDEIPPVNIRAHEFQITQIIFNLIKNADDVLQDAEERNRWIRISFQLNRRTIGIRVINGGQKLSLEIEEKLFQPFFSTKDIGHGSGLSLSVGRGVARDHGGDLIFEHHPEGTSFLLTLPLAPGE